MRLLHRSLLLTPLLAVFSSGLSRPETPASAGSVADSVGVNVHLHNTNTAYADFSVVTTLLRNLGVHHIRDAVIDTSWSPYYERHAALGKIRIGSIFITDSSDTDELLRSWPGRAGDFEGFEVPNEIDARGNQGWRSILQGLLPRLYHCVRSNAGLKGFPVYGPSFTKADSYQDSASFGQYFDVANLHNYFDGRNPGTSGWGPGGYGSIAYNLALAHGAWPAKTVVTTETGYYTDPGAAGSIPEEIEGKYMPRVILEQYLHGIPRTYIYELIDENPAVTGQEGHYGLARANGTPKPAYTALRNLIDLLADPSGPVKTTPLEFTLRGGSSELHHLLMEKRDGSYLLAFWVEGEDYDVDRRLSTSVASESVVFSSAQGWNRAELYSFAGDGSMRQSEVTASREIPLTASDTLSVLHLVP